MVGFNNFLMFIKIEKKIIVYKAIENKKYQKQQSLNNNKNSNSLRGRRITWLLSSAPVT